VRKLKGLEPRQQAVAYELVKWRNQQCEAQNKPRNFILRDDALIELARMQPKK